MTYTSRYLVCLALFAGEANAQTVSPKKGISIDFLKLVEQKAYKKVTHKDSLFVKIDNINLNLYKVEGTLSQEKYNQDMPSAFSGIKLPDFLTLTPPSVNSVLGEKVKSAPLMVTIKNAKVEDIPAKLQTIDNARKTFKEAVLLDNKLTNLYQTCGKDYTTIETEVAFAVTTFVGTYYADRSVEKQKIIDKLEEAIKDAVVAREDLMAAVPQHISQIHATKRTTEWAILEWEQSGVKPGQPGYNSGYTTYKENKENIALLAEYEDSLKSVTAKAIEAVASMEQFRKENKIQVLADNYSKINKENFTYYSDPIKVDGDKVKTKFVITAINPLACDLPKKVIIEHTYIVSGGWKVDFSTGVFASGGSEDFLGRELYYKQTDSTHSSIQSKDAGSRLLLSIGGLMHIYPRTGGLLNVAISPGVSVPTSIDGLNFHLGASAIIGRSDRVVLSAGLTVRDVKVLDRNYQLNTPYLKADLPTEMPMIRTFPKTGWFFSLSYNWSKLKKQG